MRHWHGQLDTCLWDDAETIYGQYPLCHIRRAFPLIYPYLCNRNILHPEETRYDIFTLIHRFIPVTSNFMQHPTMGWSLKNELVAFDQLMFDTINTNFDYASRSSTIPIHIITDIELFLWLYNWSDPEKFPISQKYITTQWQVQW